MYKTDKIAILLATYNGEKYIREQLESLLEQANTDWIVYVHDDGSTDKTNEILDEYINQYSEKFIRIEGKTTGSAKNNFFFLLENVEASYYMFCDQDDIWLPKKIGKTFARMKKIEKEEVNVPCLVHTELMVVDEQNEIISDCMSRYQKLEPTKVTLGRILVQNVVTGCTMMINKELRDYLLKEIDRNNLIMHDWWAAMITLKCGKISFIEQPTIRYRKHADNILGAQKAYGLDYLFGKVFDYKKIKQSLYETRIQATEMKKVFDEVVLEEAYSDIQNRGKFERLIFYKKNGIRKTGYVRQIGLIVFG